MDASGTSQEAPKPFHEDPRIRDYIERQVSKQTQSLQSEWQRQMEASRPAQQKPANKFVERLREIDPAYAEYIESLEARASKVEQLEQNFSSLEQQKQYERYESALNKLHEENKVSQSDRALIQEKVEYRASKNPKLGLSDLPGLYKQALEEHTKYVDGIKRAERAQYVSDKSKDAKAPAPAPKGTAPTPGEKPKKFTDREDFLGSVVKRALNRSKAESDI